MGWNSLVTEQELYDQAVALLAKRDYASGEIRRLLKQHCSDADIVEEAMDRLLSHHYLDDSRLVEKEIRKNLAKHHGISRIKQELRQKSLDPLAIEQALEELDVDWFELASELKTKKFGDDIPEDPKEKAKQIRYLQYRGHTMSVIMELLTP